MAEQVTIKNEFLTVDISTLGAEIQRVKGAGGTEFLWNGDEAVWSGRAPILFPICGGLKEDKYVLEGREYTMFKHGFIKNKTFTVVTAEDAKAELVFCADEETKKEYPYSFAFRVIFELTGNSLAVSYKVENENGKTMCFSVGAHEAYACPDGIENYSVVFEKNETLDSYILDGNLLEKNFIRVMENGTEFPLKYDYFQVDALVFKSLQSRKVTLVHKNSAKKVTVSFPGHDFFLLWTKPTGRYICLEPWCGIPDGVDADFDFANKEGIIPLPAGETYTAAHTITFEE